MNKHEPDMSGAPTKDQIYVGLGWTSEIISKACADLHNIDPRIAIAGTDLAKAVSEQRMVGVKIAAEAAHAAAVEAELLIRIVKNEAAVLARKAAEHLNRRSRI